MSQSARNDRGAPPRRRGIRAHLARLAAVCWAVGTLAGAVARAEDPATLDPARGVGPGWERLGSFKGSSSSKIVEAIRDLAFEFESSGSLYDDLGDLSLGLGLGDEDWRLDWDNSFSRRILPVHEAIAPGGALGSDDLSRYADVGRLGSRGRFEYDYLPDILGRSDLGARVELGFALVRRRLRNPTRIGDRPMGEVIDEVATEDSFFHRYGVTRHDSLVRSSAVLLGSAADRIAHWLGGRSADTEQGALFFELYAEPAMLAIDLGVPFRAALFTGEEPGVGVGDMVEHTTFLGLVPVRIFYDRFGLRASYQSFFRFRRETAVLRESDHVVRVRIRNVFGRGNEIIPFKVRPELRILGLVKLGYTLYESKLSADRGTSSELEYRLDLDDPRARAAFESLLGDGTRVSWRPLAEAALEGGGVELLSQELRRGGSRFSQHRLDLFSWRRYRNRSLASSTEVRLDDVTFREVSRLRNRDLVRSHGRRTGAVSSITSQGDLRRRDPDGNWIASPQGGSATRIVTSVRNQSASAADVRRGTELLATILGLRRRPAILEELAAYATPGSTRFSWNLDLSFDGALTTRALSRSDEEVWRALGELFLGPGGSDAWATEEARRRWRRMSREERDADLAPLFAQEVGGRKAPKLARRLVEHLEDLRRFATENCLPCLDRAYRKRRELPLVQALLVRLAGGADDSGLGYHFEIFVDEMLAPVTVSNGIRHEFRRDIEAPEAGAPEAWTIDAARRVEFDSSDSRLRGGFLWINRDPESRDPECWILRLFSDLVIDPELHLRFDLRDSSDLWADPAIVRGNLPIGAPTEVIETPFMTARYHYDISLPRPEGLEEGRTYTVLLRVLNDEGYPVTEEQQLRFEWPEGVSDRLAPACRAQWSDEARRDSGALAAFLPGPESAR